MKTREFLIAVIGAAAMMVAQSSTAVETGFELRLSAIASDMDGTFFGPGSGDLTAVDDSDTGVAIAGVWNFSPNWAIDLEYADHGSLLGRNLCPPDLLCIAADSPEVVETKTLTLSLLREMPLSNEWSIFARLGYADTDLNRRFAGDSDDQGGVFGLGIRRFFAQSNYLALEYRTEAANLDRFAVSWGYRF